MTTPSGSSRPKRRRTSPQTTTATSTRRKRVRSSTDNHPATEDTNSNDNASNNDPSARSEGNPTSNSQPTPTTAPTPSSVSLVEPLSAILARYKAWRKAGSPHDLRCFECHQEGGLRSDFGSLEPCETCRRVYHDACKPQDSFTLLSSSGQQQDDVPLRRWYCPICVNRGWHVTPPVLTPPQSPILAPTVPARVAASPVHEETMRAGTIDRTANSTNKHRQGSQQIETSEKEKTTDGTRRKSRFDTLSPQVESALWVLYRELESVPLAQRRIANLESEMAQLRQEVRIQRNEIELTRASGSQVRLLREEVERLKAELASRQAAVEEVEALKARNRQLEGDLERSREEVDESARNLAEWKKKLSTLIGD